jgi:hypothetical protein
MSEYVTTNWLASIGACEQSAGAGIRLDLVDDQDRNVEFFRHLAELAEVLAQLSLTFVQFSTAMEVVAEVCHDAVDDEKTILPACERLSQATELLVLVFAVLRTNIQNVLVGGLRINCTLLAVAHVKCAKPLTAKAFRDLNDALRTPRPFRVDDSDSTFSTTLLFRQLSDDGHGVGELCFAASYRKSVRDLVRGSLKVLTELSVDFVDAA